MNNNYMIPANSKKSQLILGFFTPIDLILFGSGCGITLIVLLIFQNPTITQMILMLLPLIITAFLVMPVPYYHNVLQLITNFLTFYMNRRRYFWKGWCVKDGK